MCGAPHDEQATSCARCGEPLIVRVPVSAIEIGEFRSLTYALALLWGVAGLITGFAGVTLTDHYRGGFGRLLVLGVVCLGAAVGFAHCAVLGFRLNARGCARGTWIWLCLIAAQFLTIPAPVLGQLVILVPQTILLALCFAQRGRILAVDDRLREAGVPVTIRPGPPHQPISSPEGIRRPP